MKKCRDIAGVRYNLLLPNRIQNRMTDEPPSALQRKAEGDFNFISSHVAAKK